MDKKNKKQDIVPALLFVAFLGAIILALIVISMPRFQ